LMERLDMRDQARAAAISSSDTKTREKTEHCLAFKQATNEWFSASTETRLDLKGSAAHRRRHQPDLVERVSTARRLGGLKRTTLLPPRELMSAEEETLRCEVVRRITTRFAEYITKHASGTFTTDSSPQTLRMSMSSRQLSSSLGSTSNMKSLDDLEVWSKKAFDWMDMHESGVLQYAEFEESCAALDFRGAFDAKNAFRVLAYRQPGGGSCIRREDFAVELPSPVSSPSKEPGAQPRFAAVEDVEESLEATEAEAALRVDHYLREHAPQDPDEIDEEVTAQVQPVNLAQMARQRALRGDKVVIEELEKGDKQVEYTCGNGLDYLARKAENYTTGMAMLWVLTHQNPTDLPNPVDNR